MNIVEMSNYVIAHLPHRSEPIVLYYGQCKMDQVACMGRRTMFRRTCQVPQCLAIGHSHFQ